MPIDISKFIVDGTDCKEISLSVAFVQNDGSIQKLSEILKKNPAYKLGPRNSFTELVFKAAVHEGNIPLVLQILDIDPQLAKAGLPIPYFLYAAAQKNPAIALQLTKEFVKRDAGVNLTDPTSGATALFVSSQWDSHRKVTKFLLKKGAVIFSQTRDFALNFKAVIPGFKERVSKQPQNLHNAIEELCNEFLIKKMLIDESVNGYACRNESVFSTLPAETRVRICSFIE